MSQLEVAKCDFKLGRDEKAALFVITENNKQIAWEERMRIGYKTKKENQE